MKLQRSIYSVREKTHGHVRWLCIRAEKSEPMLIYFYFSVTITDVQQHNHTVMCRSCVNVSDTQLSHSFQDRIS